MTPVASRALTWALVIAVAGVSGFAAYTVANRSSEGLRPIERTPLPLETASPSPGNDSELHERIMRPIPERLPAFTLNDLQGHPRSLSNWSDRPLLVNFWATWCEPCRREIPLLIKLRRVHAPDRLEVIGIAVDFREAVLKYGRQMGIDYPVLIGEQEGLDAIEAFGMQPVFPFSVFADRQGRIVAIRVGELHEDEADFILGEVQAIDAGQRTLEEAKHSIADKLRELAVNRATLETHGEHAGHAEDE